MRNIFIIISLMLLAWSCSTKIKTTHKSKDILKMEVLGYYQGSKMLGYLVESAKVENNYLIMNIVYEGGCQPHTFRLIADSTFREGNPPITNLFLVQDSNNDKCHDKVKKELIFDISRLQNFKHEKMILNIDNLNTLLYERK